MFVSDQIGGWLLVVSLEYILIPGDPSRGRRSRSDKWSGHGRYFVLLLLLLLSVSLSLFFLPSLPFLLFFWFTTLLPASFSSDSPPGEERFGSDCTASVSLHPGPSSFATWPFNGMEEWIEVDPDPLGFFFLESFVTSFGSFVSRFLIWFSFSFFY